MERIEIFVQGEALRDIEIVDLRAEDSVDDLVAAARGLGLPTEGEVFVFLEDSEQSHEGDCKLKNIGIGHHSRVHCHRCRKVEVTVNYNAENKCHPFPPSATVGRVKEWADRKFDLQGVDATEHALQICGTRDRPDEDIHIGALVSAGHCDLCFDLVAKIRIEG